ncbi:MAG: nucleotide exchange factor GrpE [Acidobacteriaceae bacterium]
MMHSSTKHPRQPAATEAETATSLAEEGALPELTAECATPATPETEEAPISHEEHGQLKAERDQLLDRLARLQAEFDNARKREARERAEFRDYALVSTVEQFLPVLDNFQLALRADGSAEQLRAGVELIVRQMEEVLRSLGVRPIATQDAAFDPRLHEALEMVERDDVPDHQIMEEVRRGYTLRDRLLRPALVRVASNPKQHTA